MAREPPRAELELGLRAELELGPRAELQRAYGRRPCCTWHRGSAPRLVMTKQQSRRCNGR